MKILIVNTVPTQKNGITNVIFNLIRHIKDENISFGFVSIEKPDISYEKYLNDNNIPLYILPRKISSSVPYILKLAKIAKAYDIIHVHGNSSSMLLEMISAKIAGIKLRIAHSHNTTCSNKILDKILRPFFYLFCNGRLACGMEAGRWLYNKKNFLIINNGIDVEKFYLNNKKREETRQKYHILNRLVFGHIGNFVDQKNHRFLIDIFNCINKIYPNSVLMLLGNGELEDEIKNISKNLDLDKNIIYVGSVGNPNDYMDGMDMIIMPSKFEGLPLSMVEEQANGLPILAADTISPDSNLTGLVKFKSLEDPAADWAKVALEIALKNKRIDAISKDACKEIKQKGYDIKQSSRLLTEYYRNKIK